MVLHIVVSKRFESDKTVFYFFIPICFVVRQNTIKMANYVNNTIPHIIANEGLHANNLNDAQRDVKRLLEYARDQLAYKQLTIYELYVKDNRNGNRYLHIVNGIYGREYTVNFDNISNPTMWRSEWYTRVSNYVVATTFGWFFGIVGTFIPGIGDDPTTNFHLSPGEKARDPQSYLFNCVK